MSLLKKLLLLLVIGSSSFIQAKSQDESEQLVVRLSTENQLIPIYLASLKSEEAVLDASYLKKLEAVLNFDLNHNGMTITVAQTPDKELLAEKLSATDKSWQANKIFYVVKAVVQKDKKLSAMLLAVNGGSIKTINGLALTGVLNQDRRQVHQLSDAIHKALFGTDGIATTHILYSVKKQADAQGKWVSEIWECDYDGENAHAIVKDACYNISPTYTPPTSGHTSGNFFYVAYKSAQPKIYMGSLKQGGGKRLTNVKGNQLMPAISRQRDQVAFVCDVTGNPDIFLQKYTPELGAIGKPRQIFAGRKATQGSPVFSPDGKQIAFASNKDGSPKIYVIDIPAEGVPLKDIKARLITRYCKEASAPSWSPDGKKLTYCAMTNGTRQIWLYDFETKDEYQLTQGPGNKENPTWAPNSLNIVYNCTEKGKNGNCDLFIISLNQPNATKITSGSGEKHYPSWEARNS